MNSMSKYLRGMSASSRACEDDINMPESVTRADEK